MTMQQFKKTMADIGTAILATTLLALIVASLITSLAFDISETFF
jgi:hypothetical protein